MCPSRMRSLLQFIEFHDLIFKDRQLRIYKKFRAGTEISGHFAQFRFDQPSIPFTDNLAYDLRKRNIVVFREDTVASSN